MKFPWNKPKQPTLSDEPFPQKIEYIPMYPTSLFPELTLEQWRKNPGLVTEAMKLHANRTFGHMVAVMKANSPANYHIQLRGVQPSDAILHLGEIQGYNLALNMLAEFAKPFEGKKQVPSSFTQPDPVKENPIPWKYPVNPPTPKPTYEPPK